MSLYEYAKSNPVLLTDALGGCSKSKPEEYGKCFCPISLTKENVQYHPDVYSGSVNSNFAYASFDIVLTGVWLCWEKEKDVGPQFEWLENFTTRPDGSWYQDLALEQWHDMAKTNHPTIRKFKEKYKKAPDGETPIEATYSLHDDPGKSGGLYKDFFDQNMWFHIKARSDADCPCEKGQKYKELKFTHIVEAKTVLGQVDENKIYPGHWKR